MVTSKKVLAICGSTRQHSANHNLLLAIQKIMVKDFELLFFKGISTLPQFNPDLNDEIIEIATYKQQLKTVDGVIICTPEYAHGVPGAMKNAIDWTVGTGEFANKPTVLITASTDGQFGHQSLLETLKVIEAKQVEELNLLVPFINTKVNSVGEITDELTKNAITNLMTNFNKLL